MINKKAFDDEKGRIETSILPEPGQNCNYIFCPDSFNGPFTHMIQQPHHQTYRHLLSGKEVPKIFTDDHRHSSFLLMIEKIIYKSKC